MNNKQFKSSRVARKCQISGSKNLESIIFLGYHPPVNEYVKIGVPADEKPSYPCELLYCPDSKLVQLGQIVDAAVLFPPEYPYTSSTTKILRENFAELYEESSTMLNLKKDDLIIDIGSNDGNLLSNFKDNHKVLGVTPEEVGKLAIEKGIPTIIDYFNEDVVETILREHGKAKVITATNVFAHIDDPNKITQLISKLLADDGVFINESHYLASLVKTLQYDTIYHEHLRYYSMASLKFLLEKNGLTPFFAKKIPTHGGSIRVYATKSSLHSIDQSVENTLNDELETISIDSLHQFKNDVLMSKLKLYSLLNSIKGEKKRIFGISSPSRASTLVNYVGLDQDIIECTVEINGSHKIGKYMPGSRIPVLDESILYSEQPEYALLFSWHIADELIPKLKQLGFKGKFIVPLPEPHIVE
jgi:uncharacterized protein (UPF0297 family)